MTRQVWQIPSPTACAAMPTISLMVGTPVHNPVRVIDVFVDELDLGALDFGGVDPKATLVSSVDPLEALC
jgi:hypothetical protein